MQEPPPHSFRPWEFAGSFKFCLFSPLFRFLFRYCLLFIAIHSYRNGRSVMVQGASMYIFLYTNYGNMLPPAGLWRVLTSRCGFFGRVAGHLHDALALHEGAAPNDIHGPNGPKIYEGGGSFASNQPSPLHLQV